MPITYYDWIARHAARTPAKTAVVDLATGRSFDYSQLDERIGRLARHLGERCGVKRGDRVAVLALNSTDTLEVQFACGRLGAIFVPLNVRLTVPELEYIVGDASPTVMVHDDELSDTALQVVALCKVPATLCYGADGSYERAIQTAQPLTQVEPVTHDDVSTIMYTSGTTGRPKGCMITHGMTFWNCVNLGPIFRITQDVVTLTVLPLFHTGGLNCYSNPALHAGGTVLVMRTFDPGRALELIGNPKSGVNLFLGVPANYQFMSQHPLFAEADFSNIVCAGIGGSPTPLPMLELWGSRGLALQQAFGMTETSPAVLSLDRDDALRKAGSAGKPLLHTEVRVVRPDGTDAPTGELGELWVKGPNVTPGYWNRPDATAASFTDGWLHTGDACRVDEDGFYYIVDRWKDMYISGGENVYPAEVENVLYQIPAVAEAAVIGIADNRWGETGLAIVALKPGETADEAAILGHCRANLARYKCPSQIRFIDALPRNATGKVHKPTLRKEFGVSGAPSAEVAVG
jgi:fatty-acyl-CoA synthase